MNKYKVKKWKKWFAWYPLRVESHWCWFKTIERKWIPSTLFTAPYIPVNYWVYREIMPEINIKKGE